MILPTKHLSESRCLIGVGAQILTYLDEPKTISGLWGAVKAEKNVDGTQHITYDWFILALDFLYAIQAIKAERDLLRKVQS